MLEGERRKRVRRSIGHVSPTIPTKACMYCKSRKVKCDSCQQVPCSTCVKANKECVPSNDGRSMRPSTHEVVDLQMRVAQLESYIEILTREKRDGDLQEAGRATVSGNAVAEKRGDVLEEAKRYPKPKEFQKIGTSTVSGEVYGPMSIFHSGSSPIKENLEDTEREPSTGVISLTTLNKDPTVIRYIKCFFQWLYPDIHMFIPRETFLIDFYHPRSSGRQPYCTIELVYSICAIGSLLIQDKDSDEADDDEAGVEERKRARLTSEQYYESAKKILFSKLDSPSITLLQSFLLLGLYDMYRGRNKSCWLLSGIGLRIGFDIGFHLSPNLTNSGRSINKLSLLFKSRIYWGCFIVDHFIGMILGRPSVLHIDNSTIEESERVPDLDWIKDFNFKEKDIIDVSNPLKSIVRLIVLTERSTHGIFVLETELSGKYERLLQFNKEIQQWRESLLPELRWDDVAAIREKSSKPPDMVHVYYYYIVLLCVNRPFLVVEEPSSVHRSPSVDGLLTEYQRQVHDDVVLPAVAMLDVAVSGFVDKYGYKRCSILLVYSSILIASVILVLLEKKKKRDTTALPDNLLEILTANMNVLRQSGSVWGLAAESFATLEKKLQDEFDICFLEEYDRMQQGPRGMAGLPASDAAANDFGTEWTEWMALFDDDGDAGANSFSFDFGLGVFDLDGLCPQ